MSLEHYLTPEGLIATSLLKWESGQLRIVSSGEKVWVNPVIESVADVLIERKDLWQIAKLRIQTRSVIQARAPIFGVPFDKAMQQLLGNSSRQNNIKSLFQRVDAYDLESEGRGIIATMVAHLGIYHTDTGPEVSLEAWQIPNAEAETFYLHGIFNVEKQCFTHLDGATMYYDDDSKHRLFQQGIKVKGHQKQKYFRLDGEIDIDDVRLLGKAFLPLEDLATEYLLTQEKTNDS